MASESIDPARLDEEYSNELRSMLEKIREQARRRHRTVSGLEAAILYSDQLRDLLFHHMEKSAARLGCPEMADHVCLVAVGGFGRYELGFHSDLDFCFLTKRSATKREEEFIKAALYPLWNLKVELGYSVYSLKQCLETLGSDLHRATSLLETRYIWGASEVAEELADRVHARLRKQHYSWFIRELEKETRQRHAQSDNTIHLLEPDVKNACGGLRDVHVILWIAYAQFGMADLDALVENRLISDEERKRLLDAWSFLLDLRNSLHLAENRHRDKLSIERQIQVAELMGIETTESALAEERLMCTYYGHAAMVRHVCDRLLSTTLRQTPGTVQYLDESREARRIDRDFWLRGGRLWLEPEDAEWLMETDRYWPFRLFLAVAREKARPSHETLRVVEEFLPRIDGDIVASRTARDMFLQLLATPGYLGPALRDMNGCGLLPAFLPEFKLVRHLPRIDHYHQFTVDEHLIRAVAVSDSLMNEEPPAGMEHAAAAAREILRPDLLNLALLLHDVGKGEGRAHVIRGMHAAQRVAERMNLRAVETDILRMLVSNHQKMTHTVMRRDIEDPAITKELADAVPKGELLRMLYVHSVCDLAAVSHTSWNDWRGKLLATLYEHTRSALRGVPPRTHKAVPANRITNGIWRELQKHPEGKKFDRERLDHFLGDMPERYLKSVTPYDAVKHFLLSTRVTGEHRILYSIDRYEGNDYTEITFVAGDAPGLFSNLCGALASKRFHILSAQVYTAFSGEAIDVFQVQVPPAFQETLEETLDRMCERLARMLQTGESPRWSAVIDKDAVMPITKDRLDLRPPRVDINNDMSRTHTVIEIRSPDAPGLLSEITAEFDKMSINIDNAFIATESYQVVDVFYVTDLETNKIQETRTLAQLRRRLLQTIHEALGLTEDGEPSD